MPQRRRTRVRQKPVLVLLPCRQPARPRDSRGTEVTSDYLNSQERRIIHVTLREDTRVRTVSIGDGMIKRLGVAPADSAESPGEES